MGWEAWVVIGSVVAMFGLLTFTRIGPEFILMGVLTALLTIGIVGPEEALCGLGNKGMVTVGILFMVAAAMKETGAIALLTPFLKKKPGSLLSAQARVMFPITGLSAFLNNTPVVAIFIPAVASFAKKFELPVSKLMIPLSYAAILGGTCTLIGTSTNLIVNGMLMSETGSDGLGMFEITKVGVPFAVIMTGFIFLVTRWLLPTRSSALEAEGQPNEYTAEMIVDAGGKMVGKTLHDTGFTEARGMELVEVVRAGAAAGAIDPSMQLEAGDRLVFSGVVDQVVDLQRINGLTPVLDHLFQLDDPRPDRRLVQVVVSRSCRLIGRTIVGGHFRQIYNASVVAVSRNGHQIHNSIGELVLREGDTLLLDTHPSFLTRHRNSRDFILVSQVEGYEPPRHSKAALAFVILVAMVALAALGVMGMFNAAALAAAALLLTRCLTPAQAMRSVDWQVLLVIIAAFGIGKAMQITGAAEGIAGALVGLVGENPWLILLVIYACTSLFTELITNNAGALLMFPIAMSTADRLDVNLMPFVIAIMMGASASFATPIGYQTNMMVFGPGGYRFSDYLRVGVPMNIAACLVATALIPLIWNF